uniref:Uncharacterized protein n=1 Tax=Aplanochytrium stocchinoi TaxID=215587 RepID=A0A6S8EYH3_9STRA
MGLFSRLLLVGIAVAIGVFISNQPGDGKGHIRLFTAMKYETLGEKGLLTAAEVVKGISLNSKTVIVTGGNSGIGKEAVKAFASVGADVVLAARSLERGNSAKKEIEKDLAGNSGTGKIEVMQLDLADLKTVKEFAKIFSSKYKKLHYLVNNAGIMVTPKYTPTANGVEQQFGINHLGHFYLTKLLLPTLKDTAKEGSRIINLSSAAHTFTHPGYDFSKVPLTKNEYEPTLAYGISKASNILFTLELRKRLAGSGVIAVSGHPGVIHTNLGYEEPLVYFMFAYLYPAVEKVLGRKFTKTIPQGNLNPTAHMYR